MLEGMVQPLHSSGETTFWVRDGVYIKRSNAIYVSSTPKIVENLYRRARETGADLKHVTRGVKGVDVLNNAV
jgi:hypothetical protein